MALAEKPLTTSAAIYIETYGCAFNQSDSETMAGVLEAAGYCMVDRPELADLIILNTCTVKNRTQNHFEHRFRTLKEAARRDHGPPLLIAGCIPGTGKYRRELAGVSTIGPDQVGCVAEAAAAALAGSPGQLVTDRRKNESSLNRPLLPIRRTRPHIEILPLASGCLSACTFCQTRLARGQLQSFRPMDLVRRAEQAVAQGVIEIWLTGQDTGAYGQDINYPLPELLQRLCAIEGDFRIRLGMSSPCWIHNELPYYLNCFSDPKLLTFLHIPLQSGSDRVLADMRRGNTADQFLEIASQFHQRFPDGSLVTDIIVGYPTEREEDFQATLDILEAACPAGVNRSKFSPRPGTAAARLPQLPLDVIKQRMQRLTNHAGNLGRQWHSAWIGRVGRVRAIEQKQSGSTICHNQSGRPVIVPGDYPLGQWLEVEYTGAADYHHKAAAS